MNKKNTKFVRRLIISYSALLLVVMVMGVYLYTVSINNVSEEIRTQTQLTLKKTINDMDTSFRAMDILASQIVTNSNVVRLANIQGVSDSDFYILSYHAKEELDVYGFTESLMPIKNSFIFLRNSGYILSSSQFSQAELYYNGYRSYYPSKYDIWLDMLKSDDFYRHFIPLDPFKNYSDQTYMYVLPLTEYTFKNVPAVLAFEIDYEQIRAIYEELSYYDQGYLYVTDNHSNKSFHIKANDEVIIDAEQLANLTYSDDGFSDFRLDGKELFVTKLTSNYNQWHYYLVQPADDALYSLNTYRNIFIAVILIALLLEVTMIFILSRSNLKKIRQLGTELEDTLELQDNLQKVVETQKPLIMQSYMSKILKGNIATQQELDYAQHYLNIDTEGRKFSVLYLIAYINQYELYIENSAVTVPEDIDYKELIEEGFELYFSQPAYVYSNKEGEYSVLLSFDASVSDETATAQIDDSFQQLHKNIRDQYAIWTFAGLGGWNEGLMITWKSYQQATEAVSYATKRHVFHCYENISRDSKGFYYPIELTQQLTTFINAANESQVLEIFEIIRHENMEARTLPIDVMKYLLSDVRNTLYKIRFTIKETSDNIDELQNLDTLFNQPMSLKLCEDLALALCQLHASNSGTNNIIVTIREYIDNNYKDPSLCLTKISDEFSISESYFSYLFKEKIGENFSSYLGRKRIEHAYELLRDTEINISEIYHKVGYNNSHTFRRAFKKVYGMSPKEARNHSRTA